MIQLSLPLVVLSWLFLAFPSTRWIGALGFTLLTYLYAQFFVALFVVACVAFCLIQIYQRRK